MSSDVESDDGFDPAPLPPKRRRLNTSKFDDSASCENASDSGARAKSAKKSAAIKDWTGPKKNTQKPKHLIRVHAHDDDVEDKFFTQLPDLPSSPWRIRGARWKKSQASTALADKSTNIPISTDHLKDSAAGVHKDHRSNSLKSDQYPTRGSTQAVESDLNSRNRDLSPSNAPVSDCNPIAARSPAAPLAPVYDFAQELADLPSDAFASSSSSPVKSPAENAYNPIILSSQQSKSPERRPNLAAPKRGLQQTTLFGHPAQRRDGPSQTNKIHNWPLAVRDEPPTHHKLDEEALTTYVYPTNLGNIRDYQFSIVKRALYHNLLVALPTGLGKTFIAATVMLNWFRWTKDAQIVFVAPTKPLVAQQVEACFKIAGIPRSQTTMLTGSVHKDLRTEEWSRKRVFFMTPQTLQKDLSQGSCDPKNIVLLVVDEAHRATGSYSYVEVVKFIRRFNQSFRVLALTATPGNSVETVQEVIDGLDISRIEIRTEFSIDIRQYVQTKKTEQVIFENSEEMELIMDLFCKSVQPILNKLQQFNAFWTANPMQLTPYGLTRARQQWLLSAGRNANIGVKGMVNRMFTVLATLAHSLELLKFHGIGPFYHGMINFQNNLDSAKGNKFEKEIADSEHFRKMMTTLKFWINNPEFIGHPKLDYLQSVVLKHFSDAGEAEALANGEAPSGTRIMIFAHFRDSAEEIVRVLKRHDPMIRPHVFVGQATSKGSEGMDQKRQQEVRQQFEIGKFNVLVATSIGEEGLDIAEVDLIICYDSSASPIRMLQRMGRTGRKRAGKIILLLMKGKEENSFVSAKDNYEKIQQMICDAKRFTFHDDRSRRIVPRLIEPVAHKREVEIPTENKEDSFLPMPRKGGRAPKKSKKKFHMPDGVRTGFVKASRLDDDDSASNDGCVPSRSRKHTRPIAREEIEAIPLLSDVLLTREQYAQLRNYQQVPTADDGDLVVAPPSLTAQTGRQSQEAPINIVKHGRTTASAVRAFKAMREVDDGRINMYKRILETINMDTLCNNNRVMESEAMALQPAEDKRAPRRKPPVTKAAQKSKQASNLTKVNDDDCVEAQSSSPPPTDPQLRLQSQGFDLGSDTSGEDEVEGEPSSELRDFIVDDDDEDVDVDPEPMCTSSLEGTPRASKRNSPQMKRFYVSQKSTQEGSEDEELPDLQMLLEAKAARGNANGTGEGSTRKQTSRPEKQRKRRVIEDSSD